MALKNLVSVAFLCFWVGHTTGQLSGDYLVCKPIERLFDANGSSLTGGGLTTGPRGPPGPPGKRGPRGLKGAVGPVGPPPAVDWGVINERIDASVKAKLNCSAGFLDGGYCYRLLYTSGLTATKQRGKQNAADLCGFHGGSLVDIETAQLYTKIYDYVKETWSGWLDDPNHDFVTIWLASRYQNGNVVSSTGGSVYTEWYPRKPSGSSQELILLVRILPSRPGSSVGIYNSDSSNSVAMPFCRFPQ